MGVVYHGNYFTWYEIGRTTLLKELGYSYKELEGKKIMLPVVKVSCNYIDAAKYDDVLIIESCIKELKGVKITFEYSILRKEDHKLLATGTTTHAFVNTEFKPVNFKKHYPEIYKALETNMEG
ncbi:acyl-CoA thioesterase [Alkaliphilus serpentinus]|uniref:Acyl-CoA thioesterase n=2 Tax=Alkaliphilus serpentinus TaxID=1482731 RepID=A0A833MBB8_9FIRM|nr:acyl-CoA thioesterase [Alkaliphilus serpentinus]